MMNYEELDGNYMVCFSLMFININFPAKEMEMNMNQLCDLDPMLDDIKILARCISIWKSHPLGKPTEVWSLDVPAIGCVWMLLQLVEGVFRSGLDLDFVGCYYLQKGGLVAYLVPVKNVKENFSVIGIHVTERVNPPGHYIDILEGIVKSNTTSAIKYKDNEVNLDSSQKIRSIDTFSGAGISLGTLAKVSDENFGAVGYTYTIISFCRIGFFAVYMADEHPSIEITHDGNNEGYDIANGPQEMVDANFVYAGGVHRKLIMLERKSGKRLGKEVIVEHDNDGKYVDINDEPSGDDFVDMGRNSVYALGLRRSRRNKDKEVYEADHAKTLASGSKDLRKNERMSGKEVIVEQDNDGKYIDVNDEQSDDDFVDMGRNSVYASGLQRSGRNKDKEVYVPDHAKTVASGSKSKGEKQARKRSRETHMSKAEKKEPKEIRFRGMIGFKVDGILSKLGMYVVDNFNENNKEIKFSKDSIVITKDMIGDMLGLKNEGLDVLEGNTNRDDEMVRSWKQQYADDKEITPADVKMRMRKSEEADLNFKLNFIVLFTSIMGNIHQKGLKTCKKGWKRGKKDSYFEGPLTVLIMCYVDRTKCNDSIVCRRRPPTKVWTTELLSEREAEELNCGGFGHGELEKKFVDEEGDPILKNIEGCIWMLNNYVNNITNEQKGFEKMYSAAEHMFPRNVNLIGFADKYINSLKCTSGCNNSGTNAPIHQTKEKEKDVQGEDGFHNMNSVEAFNDEGYRAQRNEEVEVGASDIGVKKPGPGEYLMGLTTNSFADVEVDIASLFGFDRQENMGGLLTQKAFESMAEEVERSTEKSKNMETDDIPSFSLSVTQDFAVIPMTNNENKVLTPIPISAYTAKGEASDVFMFHGRRSISGQQSTRLQIEILRQDYVDSNILDTWAVVRNYLEEYRSNDSPLRLCLSDFMVDKDSFVELNNDDHRFKRVDKIVKINKLKKGTKIGNSILAEMLYAAVILMADYNMMKTKVKAHMGTE
nr:major facilitator superfamily domain, general substrate transporter [Tanacetum cinerariifolium]